MRCFASTGSWRRCLGPGWREEVDQGRLSWCRRAKASLEDLGWGQQWRTRSWKSLVRAQVHAHLQAEANVQLLAKSSLETFRQLRAQPLRARRL